MRPENGFFFFSFGKGTHIPMAVEGVEHWALVLMDKNALGCHILSTLRSFGQSCAKGDDIYFFSFSYVYSIFIMRAISV